MNYPRFVGLVAGVLWMSTTFAWSQKEMFSNGSPPSGKTEIQSHAVHSEKSEIKSSSGSDSFHSSSESNSNSNTSHSSSSYDAPEPVASPPSQPAPRYSGTSSDDEDAPASTSGASPRSSSSHAEGNAGLIIVDKGNGRPVIVDAGAVAKPNDDLLPGSRPNPLPAPLDPVRPQDPRNAADANGGTLTTLDDAHNPRPPVHGIVISAVPRPDFQTLGTPTPAPTPKPTGSKPVIAPNPKPNVAPGTPPTVVPPTSNPGTGGIAFGGSDPYTTTTNDPNDYYFPIPARPNDMAPELVCLFDASDLLVAYYRDPKWCQSWFDADYDRALRDYLQCYKLLSPGLVEPWMWPCYVTFSEERSFWAEECIQGNPELQAIREAMRIKAEMVPQILVELDAQKRADWIYADTAWGAPLGGLNYYNTMLQFDPPTVIQQLKAWTRNFPSIRIWPSYITLNGFFDKYFRSDLWLVLRSKIKLDLEIAKGEKDQDSAVSMAQNCAWLCLSLMLVDGKDKEINHLQDEIRNFLQSSDREWQASPLRSLLN